MARTIRAAIRAGITQVVIRAIALTLVMTMAGLPLPARAAEAPTGVQLFEMYCAGCHPQGSNIIRRGKNLKLKALKRQHVDSPEAIAAIITNGKGLMSSYQENLNTDQITAIAQYVWQQAQADWPHS